MCLAAIDQHGHQKIVGGKAEIAEKKKLSVKILFYYFFSS